MAGQEEYERNKASYLRLKETITKTYPQGWFVGIADDQIVGAAADFPTLEMNLRAKGKDPREVLVVEAGARLSGIRHHLHLIAPMPPSSFVQPRLAATRFRCGNQHQLRWLERRMARA
jgi:hypothetical protein